MSTYNPRQVGPSSWIHDPSHVGRLEQAAATIVRQNIEIRDLKTALVDMAAERDELMWTVETLQRPSRQSAEPMHWLEVKARQLAGDVTSALGEGTRQALRHVLEELDRLRGRR